MVTPGGTGGAAARTAGGLLLAGAALAVVATFLPYYSYNVTGSDTVVTFSGWTNSTASGGRSTSVLSLSGIWLVLSAVLALAGAVTLIATARRAAPRGRSFAAFAGGFLAAAAAGSTLAGLSGFLLGTGTVEYHLRTGWFLLALAAVCGIAGGVAATLSASTPWPAPWMPPGPQAGGPWPVPGPAPGFGPQSPPPWGPPHHP